jgi:predicted protein tyrosine phosphatase
MMVKKVLFVCREGRNRSRTAAELFSKKYETRSMGLFEGGSMQINPKTKDNLEWSDIVVTMEEAHKKLIEDYFPEIISNKQIHNLDIPDIYSYHVPESKEELTKELDAKMKELGL